MTGINRSTQRDPAFGAIADTDSIALPQATILIVDDDAVNCMMLERLLAPEGYLTISVNSGREALDSIQRWTPDLILLDAMMPGMDGYELARMLKADPVTAVIPIVMITARVGHASKLDSLESGVEDHLTKPVDRNELWLRVRSLLRTKDHYDQLQNQTDLLAEQVLKSSHELQQFSAAMDSTTDLVALIDRQTMKYVQVNAAAIALFGYTREELLLMGPEQVMEATREELEHTYDQVIAGHGAGRPVETWIRGRNGLRTRFEVTRHAFTNGVAWTMVVVARDITERKTSEEKMRRLAYYDTLTELPNRTLHEEHLEQATHQADAWDLQLVLMHLDIDNFRTINESLGQLAGDELLRQVGQRLPACLYARDSVARLGSDGFAVIALTPRNPQLAVNVANKILAALKMPFEVDGNPIHMSVSIGMTLYPNDASNLRSLTRFADLAVHAAKEDGRNVAHFYTEAMNKRAQNKLELESALRGAVEREEFVLHYQPKISLRSGEWTGVEALLRWERPGHGIVLPGMFISSLEDTGLIVKVGAWALGAACQQLGLWEQEGVGPLPIAVNVSALQLTRQEASALLMDVAPLEPGAEPQPLSKPIWSAVANCLQGLMLPKGLLEIEITESAMMADAEHNVGMLHQLKEMGIRLSLDDFGTGYSSLSYLARFPLDAVKIDGSFIRGLATNPHDASITQAIIEMSHQLNMKVIAECVETIEQVDFLRANGCDEAQGFYFAQPMPVDELVTLWRNSGGVCTQATFELPHEEIQAFNAVHLDSDTGAAQA